MLEKIPNRCVRSKELNILEKTFSCKKQKILINRNNN